MSGKIGICDTTFASVDLARFVLDAINDSSQNVGVERYTVPGIKDLPVAAMKLFDEFGCDIVLALGMPGREVIDKQCAHEASMGLIYLQLLEKKHVIEVFVHADESESEKQLFEIARSRSYKHGLNALQLLKGKDSLGIFAGKGLRQGFDDEGPLRE